MNTTSLKFLITVVWLSLTAASAVYSQSSINEGAATNIFYASPGGSDANDGRGTNTSGTVNAPKTLAGAINAAIAGGNSKVWLMDGDYRLTNTLQYWTAGTNLLILQALHTNQAVISGSALVTNWSNVGGGSYTLPWTNQWGLSSPSIQGVQGSYTAYNERREMLFIDGYSLLQQCDTNGNPVAVNTLTAGQFTVDQTNQIITFKPPLGITLSAVNKVEVSVFGWAPSANYPFDSLQLLDIRNRSNLVLRGLVFHHNAGFMQTGAAVYISGNGSWAQSQQLLVDHCTFTQNNGSGLGVSGLAQVTLNQVNCSYNGARGAGMGQILNGLVQDSQFNGNDWREYPGYIGWDAAGVKTLDGTYGGSMTNLTANLQFLRCAFKDNLCLGLWQDYGGTNLIVNSCLFQNNAQGGLDFEMTPGPFLITNSVIRSNGVWGVISVGSPNGTIANSWLYGTQTSPGIGVVDPSTCGEISLGLDDRQNPTFTHVGLPNAYGQCGNWKIVNSTLQATYAANYNGVVSNGVPIFHNGDGSTGANPNNPLKLSFVKSLSGNSNQWWRAYGGPDYTGNNYLATQAFFSTNAATNATDLTFAQWTNQVNNLGHQDVKSTWGAVNLANVADPTLLNLPTATALSSSLNPSVNGNSVTFTATVQTNGVTAVGTTGTVIFYDGSVPIGTNTLSGGAATLTTSALGVGVSGISAVYAGDANYGGSTAATLAQTVYATTLITTTTSLASSLNPATNGNNVTFTASVSPSVATGIITFYDGTSILGASPVSSGVATFGTSILSAGSHSITASYGGDANYAGSTSGVLTQTVAIAGTQIVWSPAKAITTADVTLNQPGVLVGAAAFGGTAYTVTLTNGSNVNFTADGSVATATGAGQYNAFGFSGSGNANFDAVLSGGEYDNGPHTITVKNLTAGRQYSVLLIGLDDRGGSLGTRRSYFQDPVNSADVSATNQMQANVYVRGTFTAAAATQNIIQQLPDSNAGSINVLVVYDVTVVPTTTTLASSLNPSTNGNLVTFTATLQTNGVAAGAATGTVTFKDVATTLGTGTLSSGVATYATSTLGVGSHSITATYGGDANYSGSTSSALMQVVNAAVTLPTTTALVSSLNPSTNGNSVAFTATLKTNGVTAVGATGSVVFYDGASAMGTNTLGGGVATYTTSTLGVGSHSITAVYGGDTTYTNSSSTTLTQTVVNATTQIVWSSTNTITTADATLNQPGALVGAAAFGGTAYTVTLSNGTNVNFTADGSVATTTGSYHFDNIFGFSGSGNTNFDAVLSGAEYDAGPHTITVNNLTPGHQYSVLLIGLDDRGGSFGSRRSYFQDPAATNDVSVTFLMGQNVYVKGTFTAAATTQTIIQQLPDSGAGNINVLVVYDVTSLPSPWVSAAVGSVGQIGYGSLSNGVFYVAGAGAGVTGTADACQFVYQPATGNATNTVRVVSLQNTGSSAKAGVMIRETTAANAREAGMWVSPTNLAFTTRASTGGSTTTSTSAGKTAPYWVKVSRNANSFAGFYSTNGTAWTQLGSTTTISMSTNTLIGMGVTSGTTNTLSPAVMDNSTTIP